MVNAHKFVIGFLYILFNSDKIHSKEKETKYSIIWTGQHSVHSQSKYAQEKASISHTTFFAWLLVLSFLPPKGKSSPWLDVFLDFF